MLNLCYQGFEVEALIATPDHHWLLSWSDADCKLLVARAKWTQASSGQEAKLCARIENKQSIETSSLWMSMEILRVIVSRLMIHYRWTASWRNFVYMPSLPQNTCGSASPGRPLGATQHPDWILCIRQWEQSNSGNSVAWDLLLIKMHVLLISNAC